MHTLISQLRRLTEQRKNCALSDRQLLDNFVLRHDEASFEVLVWRHGTLVLNLCQRILNDHHAAEDAFQCSFLVFARKAGSIGKGEAVGSWLYKVAYRIALRLRARAARSHAWEEAGQETPGRESTDDVQWRDLRPVLDEEIDRLPEKYRAAFVLCYLEGQTNEEAAQQLGCPKGTVLSRLARGRERLRSRLTRRGITLAAGSMTASLFAQAASAGVPAALVNSTVEAAIPFAAGHAVAGLVSTTVAALTEGVLRSMLILKCKIVLTALLVLGMLGGGAGWIGSQAQAERPAQDKQGSAVRPGADKGDRREPRAEDKTERIAGKVVAVGKDGKSITLDVQPLVRGEEPKQATFALGEKTVTTYFGVGPDGARPTEGYLAQIELAKDAKDVAATVMFQGPVDVRNRRPDLAGRIAAVLKDGKGITVEEASRRPREEEAKKTDVFLGGNVTVLYFSIEKGGAHPAAGQDVQVWMEEGSPAILHINGKHQAEIRGDRVADVAGNVVAADKDGKTLTVEISGRGRGEDAKKVEIKITDKTAVAYHSVGPDGTTFVEGGRARIWLEEGSKDTAARMSFHGVVKERLTMLTGKVIGVAADGKTVTLEVPPSGMVRGEEPKKFEIKIVDKTRLAYIGVGPGGARPTEGYTAQVWLQDGSKDTAAQIQFGNRSLGRR